MHDSWLSLHPSGAVKGFYLEKGIQDSEAPVAGFQGYSLEKFIAVDRWEWDFRHSDAKS